MTPRHRRRQPELELTAADRSELNRAAHEEETHPSQDPRFREVSSAEARERLSLIREFKAEVVEVRSLTAQAALALSLQDALDAVTAKFLDSSSADEPPIEEDAPQDDSSAPRTIRLQGVIWGPNSREVTEEIQREIGYGIPAALDSRPADEDSSV